MTIRPLSQEPLTPAAWDHFVEHARNGTVFQTLRFLTYHPAGRFDDHHLAVYKGERLFAVMPAALVDEPAGRALISYPGASYGGPVLGRTCRLDDAGRLVDALIVYGRKEGYARIDLTLTPAAYGRPPDQTLEFALIRAGFGYRKREFTQIVDLVASEGDPYTLFYPKTRADVRQAVKLGVHTRWTDHPSYDELAMLHRMLCDNRAHLGVSGPPAHSVDDLIRIRDLIPGMLWFGVGYAEDAPVSSTLVFRCNPRALLTFYICHERAARSLHPVHLLLCDLIREGGRQGYRILDFGISTVNGQPLRSLIRFKESFNAHGCFRDTFEIRL